MIINCPSCEKKFQIDDSLIPENGRLVQCGSCGNSWFFKPFEKVKEEILDNNQLEYKKDKRIKTNKKRSFKNIKETKDTKKNYELTKYTKTSNFSLSKLLSYIIVLIISFTAFIVLIETFKTPLYSAFPNLELLMFSLFEILTDIKLFIKDLF